MGVCSECKQVMLRRPGWRQLDASCRQVDSAWGEAETQRWAGSSRESGKARGGGGLSGGARLGVRVAALWMLGSAPWLVWRGWAMGDGGTAAYHRTLPTSIRLGETLPYLLTPGINRHQSLAVFAGHPGPWAARWQSIHILLVKCRQRGIQDVVGHLQLPRCCLQ